MKFKEKPLELRSQYLKDYLAMVEDTESPRLFHLWAALSAVSGALGRRCWLPFGPSVIYPNQFILLVGHPGTRKSSAMNVARKMMKNATNIKFAPQDTAGQRQGIVKFMSTREEDEMHLEGAPLENDSLLGLDVEKVMDIDDGKSPDQIPAHADKHHLFVAANEFSRFIGQNNFQMLDFLTTMWDGDDYEYLTQKDTIRLKDPLLNLVGCTTPTSIAASLPPASAGQGFLSRIILVHGAEKYKLVPRPSTPDSSRVSAVQSALFKINHEFNGAFSETKAAYDLSCELYAYVPDIVDSRFASYIQRRYTHLLKLGMVLAAARGSMTIEASDYAEANAILSITEIGMPDALGQFGLSPVSQVKHEILEFCRRADGPVGINIIYSVFHKDLKVADLNDVLGDLVTAGLLYKEMPKDRGVIMYMAVKKKQERQQEDANKLLSALLESN